jgi:signal transduction histidine kinase
VYAGQPPANIPGTAPWLIDLAGTPAQPLVDRLLLQDQDSTAAFRRRSGLDALSVADLPGNLVPLVEAINGQVARVSALVETRRQFIDDASHQLRTPLTTLRAQLDYARREADPGRAQVALDALSSELDHATRATNQLLSLARADAGALQADSVDLRALAREVALALLPQARAAGIDFGLDASEAPVPARGDAVLLREALVNLAHNALVHGRGPVTIEAAVLPGGGWRLGVVMLFAMAGMAAGGWLGGFIFDATLSSTSAFQSALAFNLLNLMLLGILYMAQRRRHMVSLP